MIQQNSWKRWNILAVFLSLLVTLTTTACQNEEGARPAIKHGSSNAVPSKEIPTPIPNMPSILAPSSTPPVATGDDKPVVMKPGAAQLPIQTPVPPVVVPPVIDKSEGCLAASDLPEGEAKFTQGQFTRKYVIRKPAKYSKDKAWPVVLALHPNGGNTGYWDATSGNQAIRTEFGDKAIIVIAQARVNDWRGDLPTELAYFETVLTKVKKGLCVDNKRIFSMGFSGGGSFSGVLGCSRTDIRAIAAGGAVIYFDPKTCVGTPAAWVTIGDDEAVAGRLAFRDFWRSSNKCSAETKVLTPNTCVAYGCPDLNRPTQFCSHKGGHEWPDFGTKTAWEFFSKF